MEVVNARSALLSNYEVLAVLKEEEAEQLAQTKTALAVKKEHNTVDPAPLPTDEVSENLRTVQFELIQYLSATHQPTARQTPEGISKLVKALGAYPLTKAEKLQIANIAPTEAVELYVVVEELEERMLDQMDDILQHVKDSLLAAPAPSFAQSERRNASAAELEALAMEIDGGEAWQDDADADEDDYIEEGAFEGDLDVEED